MIRALLAAVLLLAALPALAEGAWSRIDLHDIGLDAGVKRYATRPGLDLPFASRSDRILTAARVQLAFAAPGEDRPEIRSLEVTVNGEKVATLGPDVLVTARKATIEIADTLLGDRNLLGLRLVPVREGPCETVSPGSWSIVESGAIELQSAPLPLPADLSVLPLPFWDRDFDRIATVPVVIPAPASPDRVRQAALLAGWIGAESGLPARFPVQVGALPASDAIVVADGAAAAESLGVPAPAGPSISIVEHPGHPGSSWKIVVIGGRTPDELEAALRRLAAGTPPLAGTTVALDAPPPVEPAAPYAAKRWLPPGKAVRFAEIPGSDALVHEGIDAGAMALRFRIPPDLFAWPGQWVELDLRYAGNLPQGVQPPRLDVELNGLFLGSLPDLDPEGKVGEAKLRIHRDRLQGFNELRIHVAYGADGALCGIAGTADAEVRIDPDSVLHLEGIPHFAELPDVQRSVHDGFPYTRVADLGETAVVLPDVPKTGEISTALSLVAHFASITGDAGARLQVLRPADAREGLDKDLIVVGLGEDHPLLRQWHDRLPLVFGAQRASVQVPETAMPFLELLSATPAQAEQGRADAVVGRLPALAAVMGLESPLRAGRSALVISASSAELLPAVPELIGFTESRRRGGDLLVVGGDKRWSFGLGSTYHVGDVDAFTRLRWFLSRHWVALPICVILGALAWALQLRRSLARRVRERLSLEGAP